MSVARLVIYKKNLEKYEEQGRQRAKSTYQEAFIKALDPVEFYGEFRIDSVMFKNGELVLEGEVAIDGDPICFVSVTAKKENNVDDYKWG